jgi:pimeloyl-ACP methyl ester carboxylesterase
MLEHERKRLELSGKSPAEIDESMRAFIDFYSLYLNQGMAPAEAIRSKPALARFWYDEPGGQYGRSAVYYQQVQKLNVGAAWARISAPVLILYGEYDWIMSRGDQELIVDIVNSRHPGNASLPSIQRWITTWTLMKAWIKPSKAKDGHSMRALWM